MAKRIKMDISVSELQALNKKLSEDETERAAFLENPSAYLAERGIEAPESIVSAVPDIGKKAVGVVLVTVSGKKVDRIKMDIGVTELQALSQKLAEDEGERTAFMANPSTYLAKRGIEVPESVINAMVPDISKKAVGVVLVTVSGKRTERINR